VIVRSKRKGFDQVEERPMKEIEERRINPNHSIFFFDEKQIYSTDFKKITSPYKKVITYRGIKQLIFEIDIVV
jgi:hypothetical protein